MSIKWLELFLVLLTIWSLLDCKQCNFLQRRKKMETKIFPTMIPLFLWLSTTWSFNDFHQVMITFLTLLATLTPVLSKPAFKMKLFFLQACRLKDSLRKISDGIRQWASKTLLVAEAYRKLADLIDETPTQLTESKVFSGMLTEGTKLWQMNLHNHCLIHFFSSY